MILSTSLLIVGFAVLIKGADWLVDGASALAKKYNISNLAIGLTVVAFGTSAPELVVNVIAAAQNHKDIVFGNIIGSNNFNLFVILAISGIISPLVVQSSTVWKEIPLSFFAALLLFFLANDFLLSGHHGLSRWDGVVLLSMFAAFLFYVYKQLRHDPSPQTTPKFNYNSLKIWVFIILGFSMLVLGGRLVVTNAVEIASLMGVSETIIGLTVVAVGTSLPELATSVVAATKKNNDIAIGNIIGSNIFNIFLILGISSLVRPLEYNIAFNRDLYLLAFGTIFLFMAMFLGKKKKLDRWEAIILLTTYIGYTIYLVTNEV